MAVNFLAPMQTGSEVNPVFCLTGIGTFPGVNRPGSDFDRSPQFSAKVKGRVELYVYSLSGPSCPVQDILYHVQPVLSGTGVAFFTATALYREAEGVLAV